MLVSAQVQCTATVTDTGSGTATDPTGTVTFGGSLGACTIAPTGAVGMAGCAVPYSPGAGGAETVSASYPGDGAHKSSVGQTTLNVSLRPTTTSISCVQMGVVAAGTACTITVSDVGSGPIVTPTGTVELFGSYAGAISGVASCTLASGATPGTASCANQPTFPPPDSIYATYQGDATHALSSSQTVTFVRTFITSGPSGFTSSAPQFTFDSSIAGSTFECSLDGAPVSACSSPMTYYGLSFGGHTFTVRAITPTGEIDGTGASSSFTLGQGTLSFSCTVNVPSYHGPSNPGGVEPESGCA